MKSRIDVAALLPLSALVFVGCATNPLTLPSGPRDQEASYKFPKEDAAKLKPLFKQHKQSISVFVDSAALASSGVSDPNLRGMLENNFLPDLQASLNDVSYLRTVTANPDLYSFIKGDVTPEDLINSDVPDYMLLARIVYIGLQEDTMVRNVAAVGSLGLGTTAVGLATMGDSGSSETGALVTGAGAVAAGAGAVAAVPSQVDVKVYFELFDRAQNRVKCCKTLHRQKGGVADSSVNSAIIELLEDCAEEYLNIAIADMSPLGLVIKTVGDGQFAYVTLGSDVGLNPKDKVQFMIRGESVTIDDLFDTGSDEETMADDSVTNSDAEVENDEESIVQEGQEDGDEEDEEDYIPFETIAYGTVISNIPPEDKRAWIKIADYKKVKVLKGNAVKIVPAPVKNKNSLLNRFGL